MRLILKARSAACQENVITIALGINGGVRLGYQDVSAALIKDGTVIAAVEEERLSRKHSPGQLPMASIRNVLKIGGLTIRDVDVIASHGPAVWNSVANGRLMELDLVDEIYVQPGSSDAGVSLGAAYLAAVESGDHPRMMPDAYLGEGFSNADIEHALKTVNMSAKRVDDPACYAAEQVLQNKVVGWFQGRMDFGPRAFGSRSILGNPGYAPMKDIVNLKIKFRESYRPFWPSVLEEQSPEYFIGKHKVSLYVNITYPVKTNKKAQIPAVTHIDGTARIQTCNREQNPIFYQYLSYLGEMSGHGVSLNTSFNVDNQPIVNNPLEAISTFYGCGIDQLALL